MMDNFQIKHHHVKVKVKWYWINSQAITHKSWITFRLRHHHVKVRVKWCWINDHAEISLEAFQSAPIHYIYNPRSTILVPLCENTFTF